ncbi:fused signal recognition particle receptor [Acholeplasma morum]|uniref:signal recognition particle-docking protein FtsY n=1 Tax=Paracholeplasma morum TaxID=264637 RepID=UPI001956BBEE|nr:signal recognition particle-docking protein FtsY [Paracholeplasma morum]MBM7453473.1 fused signal recognition particle receptor [Paracholeplasma morum]
MGFFKNLFSKKKNEKYTLGLHKSRETLGSLRKLLQSNPTIDEDFFMELEEIFIQADIGVETVLDFMDTLRKVIKTKQIVEPKDLEETIVDELFNVYLQDEIVIADLNYEPGELNVYLFVGVNGVGKTTSIGKLAYQLKNDKKKVLVVAGDTFRAGAIEQLNVWAKRAGVDFFGKAPGTDPSSVIYDALVKAKKEHYDVVLCDTAGRLQNKTNLMAELSKMRRVIEREVSGGPKETLLVIDATTGQNGLKQAEVFNESTQVTGVILTKLDGSAKGGIVLAIRHLYKLPIKYVGLGEKIEDLVLFDIEDYIYGLFRDFFGD